MAQITAEAYNIYSKQKFKIKSWDSTGKLWMHPSTYRPFSVEQLGEMGIFFKDPEIAQKLEERIQQRIAAQEERIQQRIAAQEETEAQKAEEEAKIKQAQVEAKMLNKAAAEFQFETYKQFLKKIAFADQKMVNKALFAVTRNQRFNGLFYKVQSDKSFLEHVSAQDMFEVIEMFS